jgi:WD40 repeat protein
VLVSCSNDCTIRKWDLNESNCTTIIKFDSPISNAIYEGKTNILHVCTWDKYIRAVDMKTNKVKSSFICSKETVRCIHLTDEYVFICGSDPVIRRFDLVPTEESK